MYSAINEDLLNFLTKDTRTLYFLIHQNRQLKKHSQPTPF